MAQVEPMDVESDFEDKENSLQLNNVLSRASCTEKGYEELDVSEISMKLRYSITPCASPMSKSYTGSCRDSKFCDTLEDSKEPIVSCNLTQSLNSALTNVDSKLSKITPLQPLATDTFGDINRNPLSQRLLNSNITDPNITITLNDNDHLDNLSLPSTSSSNTHTPEATTPTKEIPKDGGSPIMRGLKSVFSMFRSSQSPIPPSETTFQPNIINDSPSEEKTKPLTNLVSTPISVHKNKEMSPKRSSPLKDSIAFKNDLEKELLWKDETTIIFKEEKIPISKLLFQELHSRGNEHQDPNISVEYMDISHNDTTICDNTMTDIESQLAGNVTETVGNVESDGEFVDCETTFTKRDVSQNFENNVKSEETEHSLVLSTNTQIEGRKDLGQFNPTIYPSPPMNTANILECIQMNNILDEQINNNQVEIKNTEGIKVIEEGFKDNIRILGLPKNNLESEGQIQSNNQIEEDKSVDGTKLLNIEVEEKSVSNDAIFDNVKDTTMEFCKSMLNNLVKEGQEAKETLDQLEDGNLQKQSLACADNTLNLLTHSGTIEYNVTDITIEEKNNSLPKEEILDTVSNTTMSQTIPSSINTIDFLISESRAVADIYNEENKIDEKLSKSLQSEIDPIIKKIISDDLLQNTDFNLDTVTLNVGSNFKYDDEKSLQNDANKSSKTNLDDTIKDISLYDQNNIDIIKNVETKIENTFDEGESILSNSGIANVGNDTSHLTNEQVTAPTDVPLPSDNELEQEVVIKKNIAIGNECKDDSKLHLIKNDDKNSSMLPCDNVLEQEVFMKTDIANETVCNEDSEIHLNRNNNKDSTPGATESINSSVHLDLSNLSPLKNDLDMTINIVTDKCNSSAKLSIEPVYIESQLDSIEQIPIQNNSQQNDRTIVNEKYVSISSDVKYNNEKECNASGVNETYKQKNSFNNSVIDHDNNEFQIISDNFTPEIDLKIEEVEEITSAGTSPYVSVTELSLPDHVKHNLEILDNNLDISPPISPKPIKKGYNINFDDIDDPFATKTKIRLSPTPETPLKRTLPFDSVYENNSTDQIYDGHKYKKTFQEKKIKKGTKNLHCIIKDKKQVNSKNIETFDKKFAKEVAKNSENEIDYNNKIGFMDNTKIETSNVKCLNSNIDSVSNENELKELKNRDLDTNLSNADFRNVTLDDINTKDDLVMKANFNDTYDCLPKNNDTSNVDLQELDLKNNRTSQADTTFDLLKDINTQMNATTIVNLDIHLVKEADVTKDIQVQSGKDTTIQEINLDKSLIADVCSNTVIEKDCNTNDVARNNMTDVKNTGAYLENNNMLNDLDDNMTLDTENIYSITELEINPYISEVKNNIILTETGNKSKFSTQIYKKVELKNNSESMLSTNNKENMSYELQCIESLEKISNSILQQPETNYENVNPENFKVNTSNLNSNTDISTENDKTITIVIDDKQSSPNEDQDLAKISPSNISVATSSSKNTDGDITVREILTEDEDTVEGPFLEVEEYSDQVNVQGSDSDKANMLQFEFPPPLTNIENGDNDELFIDAEAFEFLLNQNKTNVIADSGKESLFLKFDPLFAKQLSSDGILTALSKIQKRQSTPKKINKTSTENIQSDSHLPGPSNIDTLPNVMLDNLELPSQAKPMMVVNPAVNPIASPRKLTPKLNRRSLTFTSPAIAVIDRLLSLNGNNSLIDQNTPMPQVGRQYSETDIAITQFRELLAEKEIHVHNLRCESKELKERLANLESQMKSLETESGERLKKINTLNERLAEKTKINKSMALVVEEYERTIASLISDIEQDKKRNAEERMKLVRERDEQTAHLASMEVSFSDLHSKYEKSKQIILSMKANEDKCRNSLKDFEDSLAKMQSNYEFLKQHATSKLNHANQELEKINKAHESEVLKLNALIKRKELHITSLEETLTQKTKANEELTAICDELINKVG